MKKAVIIGGGTFNPVRNHFSLAAEAHGQTASDLFCDHTNQLQGYQVTLVTTKMAENLHLSQIKKNPDLKEMTPIANRVKSHVPNHISSNADLENFIYQIIADPEVKLVFFNPAVCDWEMQIDDVSPSKDASRLSTRAEQPLDIKLSPAKKLIKLFRQSRKDIYVVGWKQTYNASSDEQYRAGLTMLKENSINLVFANDTKTKNNMIITPEESRYSEGTNRDSALSDLVEIAHFRSNNKFPKSQVIGGLTVPFTTKYLPNNFITVVNYLIDNGAFKPNPLGFTTGHFAFKTISEPFPSVYYCSRRKVNHNKTKENGLVEMEEIDDQSVMVFQYKASVGATTQRVIFKEHPGFDSIIHFHCNLKRHSRDCIPVTGQAHFECGSLDCGVNTSKHLKQFGNLKCVMLHNHGPNILFNSNNKPSEVLNFINSNFDLTSKTGGSFD